MKGEVGDRLVLKGTHVGDHSRIGVITELRHSDGTPPYVVRWLDTSSRVHRKAFEVHRRGDGWTTPHPLSTPTGSSR